MACSNERPIDVSAAMARCMGEPRILAAMLRAFLRDVPRRVDNLAAYVVEGRLDAMAEEAHAIKGAAGVVTASRLTAIAAALEAAGRGGDLEGARARVNELLSETACCVSCIEVVCRDLQVP